MSPGQVLVFQMSWTFLAVQSQANSDTHVNRGDLCMLVEWKSLRVIETRRTVYLVLLLSNGVTVNTTHTLDGIHRLFGVRLW